jgi:hypothetical protein
MYQRPARRRGFSREPHAAELSWARRRPFWLSVPAILRFSKSKRFGSLRSSKFALGRIAFSTRSMADRILCRFSWLTWIKPRSTDDTQIWLRPTIWARNFWLRPAEKRLSRILAPFVFIRVYPESEAAPNLDCGSAREFEINLLAASHKAAAASPHVPSLVCMTRGTGTA